LFILHYLPSILRQYHLEYHPCFGLEGSPFACNEVSDDMNTVAESTEKPWIPSSTRRVRLHRERRRDGLRLLTLEMPETAINAAIARGFLKPEDSTQAWSVIQSVYANQLSDRALNWLTDNSVITPEQRTNAAAILRCISNWVERAAAP
jgi:hypothetical protein